MPLARILTLRPEEAAALAEQLQQLGFEVEVTSPNARQLSPADLEIEFAICDQQQVLGRAGAIANELQADVVVFPAAIPPLPKAAVVTEVPVPVPEPIQAEVEAPQTQDIEPVTTATVGEHQQPAETRLTHVGRGLRKAGRLTGLVFIGLAGKLRSGSQRVGSAIAGGLARLKITTSSASSTVTDHTRAYQERVKARSAQTQAARAQRLAEMERLRAEAREQVATLERARVAAEAQHRQLQRQDAEQPVRLHSAKAARPRASQLRGVMAGAVAASVLFIAGLLLANFQTSTPPSSNLDNGSVKQQVPFGAATVHGTPGVTIGGAKTTKTVPAATALPLRQAPVQARPQPSTRTTAQAKQKSQWHHFRKNSSRNGDATADDVVVKHFGPQQKPMAKNTQQQAGMKRYSDQ